MKTVVSSAADDLRTVSGNLGAHNHGPSAWDLVVTGTAVDLGGVVGLLVADPRMVRDLHSRGVPHLAVRVRDGTGLVGQLVIPGVTNCLSNH